MTKRQIDRQEAGIALRGVVQKKNSGNRDAPIWTKIERIRIMKDLLWKIMARVWNVIDVMAQYGNNNLHESIERLLLRIVSRSLYRVFRHSGRLCVYAYLHANFYTVDLALRQNERSSSSWIRGGTNGYRLPVSRTILRKFAKQAGCQLNICTLLWDVSRKRMNLNEHFDQLRHFFVISVLFFSFILISFYLCKEKWVRRRIVWGMRGHDRPEGSRGNVAPRSGKRIGRALIWGPPRFSRLSDSCEQSKAPGSCTPISYTPPAIRIIVHR